MTQRKKIVAANWKMNMLQAEAVEFAKDLLLEIDDISTVEVVIAPPFTAIAKVNEALGKAQNIKIGAQNMHWERSGAFTGEISAAMLRDLFVRYVVIGHSERRAMFGETDEIVNRKARAAHEAGLRPIVCIGETLEQRERGNVEKILSLQLRGSLADLTDRELRETVIAYEPVWAIGTGRNANTRALMSQPDVDGALVGGASLDPRSFARIVLAACEDQEMSELSA
ncbi:MAG: triose-phosphate isomerase [Verrucomicrobia bacterium]|nr:MAG: triose-phosphate isomerase [Verrucomicrobiota bacterium]